MSSIVSELGPGEEICGFGVMMTVSLEGEVLDRMASTIFGIGVGEDTVESVLSEEDSDVCVFPHSL